MRKVLKQFELGRLILYLTIICLGLYLLIYVFRISIVKGLFPNEVVVTTQGSFIKDNLIIRMVNEGSEDTVMIYQNREAINSFEPQGFARFLVYQDQLLVAAFEHFKEDPNIGNTYHFYLSANADSVFMDMRVEGAGSGK
ncbi:MAG: hypothetical protein AAF149_10730 [Bacteroidota bacterium]